ncbi:MAG: enoyl-CoA hydratase/isomerase family protein [Pyrinomonadaceae bacterium]
MVKSFSMQQGFSLDVTDRTMIVRFTRPEIRNPLSVSVVEGLSNVIDGFAAGGDLKAVIFTGTGDIFASGADLREIAGLTPNVAREFAERGQRLMTKISAMPMKTIAAVNGYCFGGALDLAVACDRRVASPNAKFAHPGAGLGIITGWSGTQRLPRLIGVANALEMFFTASPIDATRALQIGLIDEVAEDAFQRALETLR